MAERRYVSPVQVARALGVGVTTVKRWVDEGILPAHRTAGGHRKILLADVVRLARERGWPQANLALLTGPLPVDPADTGRLAGELYEALAAGDAGRAGALLEGASRGGLPVEKLADEVISPAMARLGHGWEEGRLDVYQEHRGTQACLKALLGLKRSAGEEGEGRPVAVGGGPEGDPYLLANLLIEMLLQDNGWRVVNLGPNTPLESFRKAVRELRPRLLWLSCGYLRSAEDFLDGYRALSEEARGAGVAVAVGGRALVESVRTRMAYTMYGDGLTQLADFARALLRPSAGG